MIGYYNNSGLSFNLVAFKQFCAVADFVNLLHFLQTNNINIMLVPFFFVLVVVHIVLLIVGYRAYQRRTDKMSKSVS